MERLIIKNFGPISNAEIDIKKYTLLIGDTSAGKSVIAKLICIFRELIIVGVDNIEDFKKELERYAISYLNHNTEIKYSIGEHYIQISNEKLIKPESAVGLSMLEEQIKTLELSIEELLRGIDNNNTLEDTERNNFSSIIEIMNSYIEQQKKENNFFRKKTPLYIPAERMLFSMLGKSIAGLWANNVNISKSFLDFAGYFEVAKSKISKLEYSPLNFTYYNDRNEEYIVFNDKNIDLKHISSGIQAILPLIIVLSNIEKEDKLKIVCIEEPEISLFPHRQKELLEYIVSSANSNDFSTVITTHSPYILSAFNNLILANNTAEEKSNREKEIEEIISKDKWVKYEEVSAYEVKDGTIISLMDEEYKSFDVNAIDRVSDRLSEQLDGLLDIRYEE